MPVLVRTAVEEHFGASGERVDAGLDGREAYFIGRFGGSPAHWVRFRSLHSLRGIGSAYPIIIRPCYRGAERIPAIYIVQNNTYRDASDSDVRRRAAQVCGIDDHYSTD